MLLLALLPARREFHRETLPPSEQHASGWLVAITVVLTTAFRLGLFSYKHLGDAAWWHFTLYDNAARFFRAAICCDRRAWCGGLQLGPRGAVSTDGC
jgi:phosphatidylglycerol lysyltransferase